ncbi:MAG: HpcH/HpaI aldolase family protein [Geminicoccaceae bacterium]
MRANRLRELCAGGGAAINGWVQIPNGFAAEIMASQPWDSLTIDMQHGPVDYQAALCMLQAMSHKDPTPTVRVPWNEPGIIMKCLDAGAMGIICPMVNTAEQAEQFVKSCRYPPHGFRSFGPTRALLYAGSDYPAHANDSVLTFAMIETKEAVDNLDAILDTPGLDGVYIGPADLCQSFGAKERVDLKEPEMVAVLDKILDGCVKRKLICGIHTLDPNYARHCVEKGYQFVTIAADGKLLANACQDALKIARGEGSGADKASGPY